MIVQKNKYKEMSPEELNDLRDRLLKDSDNLKVAAESLIMKGRVRIKAPKQNWHVTPWRA